MTTTEDAAVVAFIAGWIAGTIVTHEPPVNIATIGDPIVDADGLAYTVPLTLQSGRKVDIIVAARDD